MIEKRNIEERAKKCTASWDLSTDDLAECAVRDYVQVGHAGLWPDLEEWKNVLMRYRGKCKHLRITDCDTIGSFAFAGNEALEGILIFGAAQILDGAFAGCPNLKAVLVYSAFGQGLLSIGSGAFSGCTSLELVRLPETLKTIGEAAFTGCSSLRELEIPDSVVSIGEAAFAGCTELSITKLPKDLKVIESNVFSQVASVCDLPESVLIIKEETYKYCFPRDFYVPKSVKYIGRNAFPPLTEYEDDHGCILFGGTEEEWNAIEIDKAGGRLDGYKIKFNCKRRDRGGNV